MEGSLRASYSSLIKNVQVRQHLHNHVRNDMSIGIGRTKHKDEKIVHFLYNQPLLQI